MLDIIVTDTAENDMRDIFDYIAKDNINKAIEMIDMFEDKFNSIAMFPNSGFRKSYFIKRDVREIVVAKHYQIIYYIKNDIVYIQRVLTGYQNIFQ